MSRFPLILFLFSAGLVFISKASNGELESKLGISQELAEKLRALKFVEKSIKLSLIPRPKFEEEFKKSEAENSSRNENLEKIDFWVNFKNFKNGPSGEDFEEINILRKVQGLTRMRELFEESNFEYLGFKKCEKEKLEEMIGAMSEKIGENIRYSGEKEAELESEKRIKPKESENAEKYEELETFIFYAAFYKNLMNFLEKYKIGSVSGAKKLLKMVKLPTIRRMNEAKKKLAAERKFGGSCADCKKRIEEFEGKLAEEKKLLVEFTTAYDAKGNSLKYLAKWMKYALSGLREEIGKIAHVDKLIDKAMKWMDWLIWEEVIPHGGRTMAAGQELGKFELEMPKDEGEGEE